MQKSNKLVDWVIEALSNTVGKLHFPWVDKKFDIRHYFEIEKLIRYEETSFLVGLVNTYGHGTNILIKGAYLFSKDSRKRRCKVTHAFAHIGIHKGFKHRVVEAVGSGIREVPLLHAIGQKDIVVLRKPNPEYLTREICEYAIEYLQIIADRDAEDNIEYDNSHNYGDDSALDCSETVYQALSFAFDKAGVDNLVQLVERGGKQVWSPADIYFSPLFITVYDSREGFLNGWAR